MGDHRIGCDTSFIRLEVGVSVPRFRGNIAEHALKVVNGQNGAQDSHGHAGTDAHQTPKRHPPLLSNPIPEPHGGRESDSIPIQCLSPSPQGTCVRTQASKWDKDS